MEVTGFVSAEPQLLLPPLVAVVDTGIVATNAGWRIFSVDQAPRRRRRRDEAVQQEETGMAERMLIILSGR